MQVNEILTEILFWYFNDFVNLFTIIFVNVYRIVDCQFSICQMLDNTKLAYERNYADSRLGTLSDHI